MKKIKQDNITIKQKFWKQTIQEIRSKEKMLQHPIFIEGSQEHIFTIDAKYNSHKRFPKDLSQE